MPGFQSFSNTIISSVNDGSVIKFNAMVMRPCMLHAPKAQISRTMCGLMTIILFIVSPLTGVPCDCEGDDATVGGNDPTEGGAEPCEDGCCWSSLSVCRDASPALIDSIMASTSSAVGNSFSVGDGTRPVERLSVFYYHCAPSAKPATLQNNTEDMK